MYVLEASCGSLLLCSLQNTIRVKDRELDAAKKEATTLKSTLSSSQR